MLTDQIHEQIETKIHFYYYEFYLFHIWLYKYFIVLLVRTGY